MRQKSHKVFAYMIICTILISLFAQGKYADVRAEEGTSEVGIGEAYYENEDLRSETSDEIVEDSFSVTASNNKLDYCWQVFDIMNRERTMNGHVEIVMDKALLEAATIRANEIKESFSHTRPNGTQCFTAFGDKWFSCGENIAYGQSSPDAVMNTWLNSEGHRANIMSDDYNAVGIGCIYVNGTYYWVMCFGGTNEDLLEPAPRVSDEEKAEWNISNPGIYVLENSEKQLTAGMTIDNPQNAPVEYSWYASKGDGNWTLVNDWRYNYEWINFKPEKYGDYTLVAKARIKGDDSSTIQAVTGYSYHPYIKGKCQMPYTGEGGGYLIGLEVYPNTNPYNPLKVSYCEMLILDCTLLAAGKPAWIYTTGKCPITEQNALWTIWQPQYGYYWTLFRVYDQNGNLIDEECYGFQNIL